MKILLINGTMLPSYNTGGTAYTTYDLAKSLQNNDNEIFILTTNLRSSGGEKVVFNQTVDNFGLKIRYSKVISNYSFFKTFSYDMITWFLKNYKKFDIFIINTAYSLYGLFIGFYLNKYKLPYIIYSHGSFDSHILNNPIKKLWWKLIDRKIFNNANSVIALTNNEKQGLRMIGLKSKCHVIGNGVNVSNYKANYKPKKEIVSFIKNNDYILFLGRVVSKKGVDILLKAFKLVLNQRKNTKLIIAGPHDKIYYNELISLVNDLNIDRKVMFLGSVSGDLKWWLFSKCAFFALPSHSEGLPIGVLEALAKNKPVAVSKYCNVADVENENLGIIHKNLKSKTVASDYLKLLGNNKFKNGRDYVKKKYSWEKIAQETTSLLKNIINEKDIHS